MSTELTTTQQADMPLSQLGKVLADSGFFADSRSAAQAITKVLAGREMGIGPIAAMTGINIIKGRVAISANLIAAQIKRSGRYDYQVISNDDSGCELAFFERRNNQMIEVGRSTFGADDAKAAGLATNDNYRKFPRNMHFARAMSNGARWYAPDIAGGSGVYTPEELSMVEYVSSDTRPALTDNPAVDAVTGEVIDNRWLGVAQNVQQAFSKTGQLSIMFDLHLSVQESIPALIVGADRLVAQIADGDLVALVGEIKPFKGVPTIRVAEITADEIGLWESRVEAEDAAQASE